MSSDPALCQRCAGLLWKHLASLDRPSSHHFYIRFSAYSQWDPRQCPSSCGVGMLLRATIEEYGLQLSTLDFNASLETNYLGNSDARLGPDTKLVSISNAALKGSRPVPPSAGPSPTGWLLLEQPVFGSLRAESEMRVSSTNWPTIREWFQQCQKEHGGSCRPPRSSVPGLMVIDCTSRRIVPAPPRCSYTALSYVWGLHGEDESTPRLELPKKAPLVIEDAIVCTQKVGLRYLWVDRYCIDQESAHKHQQIQSMDQIYGSAALTLINAAGESSHDGLPGVSRASRAKNPSVLVGRQRLTLIPHIQHRMENTKWASRGWTFQEGLLSRRRLVFTHDQAYFQCLQMHCCEFGPKQLISHRRTDLDPYQRLSHTMQVFPETRLNESESPRRDFDALLKEYLRRRLAFQSDALNAFMGLLRYFWLQKRPVYHFWGVPFWSTLQRDCPDSPASTFIFMKQLFWLPVAESSTARLEMREGFPSWSWAAWTGLSMWALVDGLEGRFLCDKRFEPRVAIEDVEGRRMDVALYIRYMQRNFNMYNFHPHLYVSGWTSTVRFRETEEEGQFEVFTPSSDAVIATANVMDVQLPDESVWSRESLLSGEWPMLLFANRADPNQYNIMITGLVLVPLENRNACLRVGVLVPSFAFRCEVSHPKGKQSIGVGSKALFRKRQWKPSESLRCEWLEVKLV